MAIEDIASLDELTELGVASFRNQLPDKNVGQNSDNWTRVRITAGLVADLHSHLLVIDRDLMPDTAGEERLERHGEIHGVTRKGASPASGDEAGRIRGTAGSTWATTDILVHTSGRRFRPTVGGAIPVLATEALVGIISVDVGPETRLTAGEVLTWQGTTPAGLESEVELVADLDVGGEAKEALGSYRTRVLTRIAQPAQGGNANDWEQWALESSAAIATAYVYPNRNGLGSVDLAALKAGRGTARLLDSTERAALLAYVDERRPVSAAARVIEVITQNQDVEVTIIPKIGTQFARDWDDSTPLEVDVWTAGTRLLEFTTNRPASMAVGHRLTVGGSTSGVEFVIESFDGTAGVILKDALGQLPGTGSPVYSGGPLVTPTRDAILALFDSLGPRLGGFGFGNWEGSLLISALSEAAQTPDGVRDIVLVTPTVNVEPTAEAFPDDTQVRLLIPDTVLVRYA